MWFESPLAPAPQRDAGFCDCIAERAPVPSDRLHGAGHGPAEYSVIVHLFIFLSYPNRDGCFFIGTVFQITDSKGGSWRCAGGTPQPPWLFRRKASPSRPSAAPFYRPPFHLSQPSQQGWLFFYLMDDFRRETLCGSNIHSSQN